MGMATITDTPTMATDTTDIIRAITRDTEKAQPIRVLSDICAHHAPRPVVGVSLALDECRRSAQRAACIRTVGGAMPR
jgi:hypothetical protein